MIGSIVYSLRKVFYFPDVHVLISIFSLTCVRLEMFLESWSDRILSNVLKEDRDIDDAHGKFLW